MVAAGAITWRIRMNFWSKHGIANRSWSKATQMRQVRTEPTLPRDIYVAQSQVNHVVTRRSMQLVAMCELNQ